MLNPMTERNVPRATKRPFCGFFWLIHGIKEIGVISWGEGARIAVPW